MSIRKELTAAREAVNANRDSFTDPVAVLHRKTLASDKRSTIASNLDRQGPMGVKEAMQNALASNDMALGTETMRTGQPHCQ